MSLLHPGVGEFLTCFGAVAEAIGLPLAILDYRWPQKAKSLERAISAFALVRSQFRGRTPDGFTIAGPTPAPQYRGCVASDR
jgi:hypothetical protein